MISTVTAGNTTTLDCTVQNTTLIRKSTKMEGRRRQMKVECVLHGFCFERAFAERRVFECEFAIEKQKTARQNRFANSRSGKAATKCQCVWTRRKAHFRSIFAAKHFQMPLLRSTDVGLSLCVSVFAARLSDWTRQTVLSCDGVTCSQCPVGRHANEYIDGK